MNPQTIHVSFDKDRGTGFDNYYCVSEKPFRNSIEYHLAPFWHDVKTDPPKERGVYAVGWYGTGGYWVKGEWCNGKWWDIDENKPYNPQPDFYYVLPEPPKKEK